MSDTANYYAPAVSSGAKAQSHCSLWWRAATRSRHLDGFGPGSVSHGGPDVQLKRHHSSPTLHCTVVAVLARLSLCSPASAPEPPPPPSICLRLRLRLRLTRCDPSPATKLSGQGALAAIPGACLRQHPPLPKPALNRRSLHQTSTALLSRLRRCALLQTAAMVKVSRPCSHRAPSPSPWPCRWTLPAAARCRKHCADMPPCV